MLARDLGIEVIETPDSLKFCGNEYCNTSEACWHLVQECEFLFTTVRASLNALRYTDQAALRRLDNQMDRLLYVANNLPMRKRRVRCT